MISLLGSARKQDAACVLIGVFFVSIVFSMFRSDYQGALYAYLNASVNIGIIDVFSPCISVTSIEAWISHSLANQQLLWSYRPHPEPCTTDPVIVTRYMGFVVSPGYLFVLTIFSKAFPFIGVLASALLISAFCHSLTSSLIYYFLTSARAKTMFLVVYSLNPIVLWVVMFPYYYSFLPLGAALAFLIICAPKQNVETQMKLYVIGFSLLSFITIVRPTSIVILLLVGGVLAYQFWFRRYALLIVLMNIALVLWILSVASVNGPWHSALTGLSAYKWQAGVVLSDSFTTDAIAQRLGINVSDGPLVYQIGVNSYIANAKAIYLESLISHPSTLLLNTLRNVFGSLGFGYFQNSELATNFSTLFGILTASAMVASRKWKLLFLCLASYLPIFYFPPIQSYNSFNLLLVVVFWVGIVNKILDKRTELWGGENA